MSLNIRLFCRAGKQAHERLLYLFPVICLFFMIMVPSSRANESNRVIIVGLYLNEPKIFIDRDGNASGFFIDLLEHIAEEEGWTLQYRSGTWRECLDQLEKGEIDILPDMAQSEVRDKIFDLNSEVVLSDWFQIFAPPGSGIESVLDLDGKRIAVLEGSIQQAALTSMISGFGIEIKVIALPENTDIFRAAESGKVDAAVSNQYFGASNAAGFGLEETAVIFFPTRLFFAAPKGRNGHILERIDINLRQMKKDSGSEYYSLLKYWLLEHTEYSIPLSVKLIIAGVLLLAFVGLSVSYLFKIRLNSKTRELRIINRDIESRIITRTKELADATEKARSADRMKTAFLTTMSHELRTPLSSIIGFTGILLKMIPGPLNKEQEKQLNLIQNSARHLLTLINDILDISKIEAGRVTLTPGTVDLGQLITKAAGGIRPQAEAKGLELTVDLAPGLGTLTTDSDRLEQVLINILHNAVKFTSAGSVNLNALRREDRIEISVRDTGIGIKPEDLPDLFIPFHQLHYGTEKSYDGTGLGLSISLRIMELLEGSITVDSTPGVGSTFTIILPLHDIPGLRNGHEAGVKGKE